jgi:hypothetical protein
MIRRDRRKSPRELLPAIVPSGRPGPFEDARLEPYRQQGILDLVRQRARCRAWHDQVALPVDPLPVLGVQKYKVPDQKHQRDRIVT